MIAKNFLHGIKFRSASSFVVNTCGLPCVIVPVLSKTTVSTLKKQANLTRKLVENKRSKTGSISFWTIKVRTFLRCSKNFELLWSFLISSTKLGQRLRISLSFSIWCKLCDIIYSKPTNKIVLKVAITIISKPEVTHWISVSSTYFMC